jgi:hypothetical protein
MKAAVLQGVLTTTFDTDIWVDLSSREYVRLMNLVLQQGGTAVRQTVYALADGQLVNFLFQVNGIGSFAREFKGALTLRLEGLRVKVLPLSRILKSKKTILRDKDKLHILLIERVLRGRRQAEVEK